MDYSKFIVSNQKEESIGKLRVKEKIYLFSRTSKIHVTFVLSVLHSILYSQLFLQLFLYRQFSQMFYIVCSNQGFCVVLFRC